MTESTPTNSQLRSWRFASPLSSSGRFGTATSVDSGVMETMDPENPAMQNSQRNSSKTPRVSKSGITLENEEFEPVGFNENSLLVKVARGMRQSPLSREDFEDFLKESHTTELLHFFNQAEVHEKTAINQSEEAKEFAFTVADRL